MLTYKLIMSRRALSLADKISALDRLNEQPSNSSLRSLEKIVDIPESTIRKLRKPYELYCIAFVMYIHSSSHRVRSAYRAQNGSAPMCAL